MRKRTLFALALLLMCFALTCTACADYGYTSVDQIPMAADFSFRVDFDDAGHPHVVTDYPYETTGATEMNLIYNKGDVREAFSLNYTFATGATRVGSWDGSLFKDDYPEEEIYQALRNGEVTLDDEITVNTSHFNWNTDWFLTYSVGRKNYSEYSERTYAQGFNAMGAGGVEKAVYYYDGQMSSSRVMKRIDDADLMISFNQYGEMTDAYIYNYSPEFNYYQYNPSTGLFSGHSLTELGFEESDLSIQTLAARGTQTETVVSVPASVPADTAVKTGARSSTTLIGGLLAGIMIGITLYYMFRRRKAAPKEQPVQNADNALRPDSGDETATEPAAAVEPPEVKYMSSGR